MCTIINNETVKCGLEVCSWFVPYIVPESLIPQLNRFATEHGGSLEEKSPRRMQFIGVPEKQERSVNYIKKHFKL